MEKLIIDNRTNRPIDEVLEAVKLTIAEGRISNSRYGKQYCSIVRFENGIIVCCDKTKRSDKFTIDEYKEAPNA